MCSYKSLLPHLQSLDRNVQSVLKRQREELDRNVQLQVLIASALQSVLRQREELDRNVQLQVLIASVLQLVLTDREKNQIGMCSYKSLLPQPCSRYSQTESRTRQECATTSPYCLSPAVITQRQGEELDRNVQIKVLIASVLHSVIKNREKNQIGMCSYKSLLPQSCSQYSQTERRTRQECAATSPYCLSPAVSTQRQREELDRNVQLQVLIASALQSVLKRQREELDRNVQLQVLIASALQSVLRDREKNQIGMCSYKSLLPQSCSRYSQTERRTRQECAATSPYCLSPVVSTKRSERRTRQECAATSPYCLSPVVSTHRQREELDRNVQLQVLIASALQSVLRMCSYREKN